jgi:calcium-binding protein CML
MWSHYLNRYLWLNPDGIQSSLFNVFRMRCYVFCRSTGSIEELENVDCKSTGSIEEAENDDHMIPAVTEMKRVFATYDENGDGYICKSELEKFMRKLDVDVSEEEISYMIDSVDVNRDGCVDFEEFLELHASLAERAEGCGAEQHDEDAELLEAFQVFDRNQDGFISETELQFVLRNLGINPGVKVQDCQRMISAVDRNNDGQVDFSEFQQLMSSSISCAA